MMRNEDASGKEAVNEPAGMELNAPRTEAFSSNRATNERHSCMHTHAFFFFVFIFLFKEMN